MVDEYSYLAVVRGGIEILMSNFFDGHYVEDIAAARVSNLLSHKGIELSDEQREDIARTIMGTMLGHLVGAGEDCSEFYNCRVERWGLQNKCIQR